MYLKKYLPLICICILLTTTRCSGPREKIRGIRLSWVLPILDKELDTVFKLDGSSRLYFYQDIFLYEKESTFIHADNSQEKVYTYWMYKQDHLKGIRYKGSFKDTTGVKFDVDSFLVKNAFKTFPFYSKENDVRIAKKEDHKGGYVEKYVPKNKPDDSYPDTMIFRYSKQYQDIPFSFSREMEAGRNGKLVEITGIYNPIINSKYRAQQQGRKILFRIKRITVADEQEKMLYFERFKSRFEKLTH